LVSGKPQVMEWRSFQIVAFFFEAIGRTGSLYVALFQAPQPVPFPLTDPSFLGGVHGLKTADFFFFPSCVRDFFFLSGFWHGPLQAPSRPFVYSHASGLGRAFFSSPVPRVHFPLLPSSRISTANVFPPRGRPFLLVFGNPVPFPS